MAISDTPQISKQTFTNPGTPAIPTIPSIKNLMTGNLSNTQKSTTGTHPEISATVSQQPATPETIATETSSPAPEIDNKAKTEDFATCWTTMFAEIFSNNLLIYHSLKDEVPQYENSEITITVKNGIQQEELEQRKKAILEYWRNHFTLNVDDLNVVVNENKETKEVIINSEDRMRHMMQQNKDLADCLNILGFSIKD